MLVTILASKVMVTFDNGRIYDIENGVLTLKDEKYGLTIQGRPDPIKDSLKALLLPDDMTFQEWIDECVIMGSICELYKIEFPHQPTAITVLK